MYHLEQNEYLIFFASMIISPFGSAHTDYVHAAPFAKSRCALFAAAQLLLLMNWRSLQQKGAAQPFMQA
jgi:hypothetical protein